MITWKLKPTVLAIARTVSASRISAVVPGEANALGDRRSRARARVALDLEELVLAHQPEGGQHGEEGDRVDEEADAGATEADDHAGDRGADDPRAVEEARVQRDRVRQLVATDHLKGECLPARCVDDERSAAEEREQVDDRDVLPAGEREHGEPRRDRHLRGLRRHHELAVVEAVGDHARVEAEEHERQEPAEREAADGERRARQLDDEPGERDVLHPGAGERDHLAGEEQAIVPVDPEGLEDASGHGRSFSSGSSAASTAASSRADSPFNRSASQIVRRERTERSTWCPFSVT